MSSVAARNLIDGAWATTSQSLESLNPADSKETVGTAPLSGAAEVDAAVAAAKKAFHAWRDISWLKRAEFVAAFAHLIKGDNEDLSRLVTRECGKPLNEGRADVVE